MKASTAEVIKSEATRALLTCRCGHSQVDHVHFLKEGCIVGTWGMCCHEGDDCNCQAFHSLLSSGEKRDIDRELDRRVEASTLAAVMRDQPLPTMQRRSQFPSSTSPKLPKGSKGRRIRRMKERVKSAEGAGISHIYKGTATKTAKGKYLWEEL